MAEGFHVDIGRAQTPAARFYLDADNLRVEADRVFARSWQLAGNAASVAADGDFFTADVSGEPLLIVNDRGTIRGFYNVCRHRAGPIAHGCGRQRKFTCRYHGWTYDLEGRLLRAPEMEGVSEFDVASVRLEPVRVECFGPLLFVALDPGLPSLEEFFPDLAADCAPYRFDGLRFVTSRVYTVKANWKLYIDNYLESYHIPLVHPGLNRELDYDQYVTVVRKHHSKQYAPIRERAAEHFRATPDAPPASYMWLYPNTMFNCYQGLLQTNVVIPRGIDCTEVRFDWFAPVALADPATDPHFAELLQFSDEVQDEDGSICEQVQYNVRSRAYRPGPYSPERERGVHHFHSLLGEALGALA